MRSGFLGNPFLKGPGGRESSVGFSISTLGRAPWGLVAFLALALVAWAVLLVLQSPTIAAGDSGETVTAAVLLGVSHPPGHPLVVLLDHLALQFPVGPLAFRVGLFASLLCVLCAILWGIESRDALARWDRRWQGAPSQAGGVLAFALLLVSPMTLQAALTAKGTVYALASLGAVVLWRFFRWGEAARDREVISVALTLGLAAAAHWPTAIVLSVPAWVWFLDGRAREARRWAFAGTGFLLGLSVYLFLPLRAAVHPEMDWGHPITWEAFTWVVTRAAYSEWAQSGEVFVPALGVLSTLGKEVLSSFPGALLGGVGLWAVGRRRDMGFGGWVAVLLAATVGIVMFPRYRPESLFLASTYWTPFQGLWVFLSVLGFFTTARHLGSWRKGAMLLLAPLCLLLAPIAWPKVVAWDRSRDLAARDLGVNLLQSLPRDAVLLAEADTPIGALYHARHGEGLRPDAVVIPAIFTGETWGLEAACPSSSGPLSLARPEERVLSFIQSSRGQGREVFANLDDGLVARSLEGSGLELEPFGLLLRVIERSLGGGKATRSTWEAFSHGTHRGVFPPGENSRWDAPRREIVLYGANAFSRSGIRAQALGDLWGAVDDHARSVQVDPGRAEYWTNLSAAVAALGRVELARDLCWKALSLDERFAPAWHNLGNIETLQGRWDEALRAYDRALVLRPDSSATQRQRAVAQAMAVGKVPARADDEDAAKYRALAERLEREGRRVLSDLARDTARRLEWERSSGTVSGIN